MEKGARINLLSNIRNLIKYEPFCYCGYENFSRAGRKSETTCAAYIGGVEIGLNGMTLVRYFKNLPKTFYCGIMSKSF